MHFQRFTIILSLFVLGMTAQAGRPPDSFDFEAGHSSISASDCRIGTRELLSLLLESPTAITKLSESAKELASPEKVLFTLMKEPPPSGWKNFAAHEYGDELGNRTITRLQGLHPALEPLVASPGIVNHLDELETFVKTLPKNEQANPILVYRKFKKYLGTRTYFRGMTLTPGEFQEILQNGFVPRFYRIPAYLSDMKDSIRKGIGWGVGQHLSGASFFTLSVTQKPEIALCVANEINRHPSKRGLFLFEIEIPKLEAFEYGQRIPYPQDASPIWNDRVKKGISLELRTKNHLPLRYPLSPEVETFVVGGIESQQIKKVWIAPESLDIPTYGEGTWVKKDPTPDAVERVQNELWKKLESIPLQLNSSGTSSINSSH